MNFDYLLTALYLQSLEIRKKTFLSLGPLGLILQRNETEILSNKFIFHFNSEESNGEKGLESESGKCLQEDYETSSSY